MNIEINDIKISHRKRRLDMAKVAELASSILELGLINPITVSQDNGTYKLVAGLHRLEACKVIQWTEIPATLFKGDDLDAELAEIDENLRRNELTKLEMGEHLERREQLLDIRGERAKAGDNQYGSETVSLPKTTAAIAAEVGVSKRSAQQFKQAARNITEEVKDMIRGTDIADSTTQLLELARMKPEEQKEIVELIESGEKDTVKDAKRVLRRRERIEEIQENVREAAPLTSLGVFPVLYADPPWQYEHPISDSRRIENQYPTMPIEDICALPISVISASDSIIFLWASTPMLKKALAVLDAWGFYYRTSMVWVKPSIGPGQWVRQRHELLLIGVKGSIPTPKGSDKPDSVIEAPRTEHSKKPEVMYEIIERMYPELPKIELFCREERDGWASWGNEL